MYPSQELTDDDTARRTIDDYSDAWSGHIPSILDFDELPPGVIDELQSKKFRGRGRFEMGYMKERIVQDAYDKWVKGRKMLTPLQEKAELEKMKKEEENRGKKVRLSEETEGLIREMQAMTLREKKERRAAGRGVATGGGENGVVVDVGTPESQPEVRL